MPLVDGDHLNLGENCGETTWHFTYLRTDEAEDADFWQIRVSGDDNNCLAVPVAPEHLRGGLLTGAPPVP